MKNYIFLVGLLMGCNIFSMGNESIFCPKSQKNVVSCMPHEQDDIYILKDFVEEVDEIDEFSDLALNRSTVIVLKKMHTLFNKKQTARL